MGIRDTSGMWVKKVIRHREFPMDIIFQPDDYVCQESEECERIWFSDEDINKIREDYKKLE